MCSVLFGVGVCSFVGSGLPAFLASVVVLGRSVLGFQTFVRLGCGCVLGPGLCLLLPVGFCVECVCSSMAVSFVVLRIVRGCSGVSALLLLGCLVLV